MIVCQAAAPVGWTKLTAQNDKALRVVSGDGGGSGGTIPFSTTLAHNHPITAHTHSIPSASIDHKHQTTIGRREETGAEALVVNTLWGASGDASPFICMYGSYGGVLGAGWQFKQTNNMTAYANGQTGSSNPNTGNSLGELAYVDVILVSKD